MEESKKVRTEFVLVSHFNDTTSDDLNICQSYDEAVEYLNKTDYKADWFSIEKRFIKIN